MNERRGGKYKQRKGHVKSEKVRRIKKIAWLENNNGKGERDRKGERERVE